MSGKGDPAGREAVNYAAAQRGGSGSGRRSSCTERLPAQAGRGSLAVAVIGWCLRLVLAALFFYAGWVKLLQPADFVQDVLNYQWVEAPLALWIAVTLPPLEMLLAICLLVRTAALPACVLLGGLCTVFCLALLSAWVRGLDIACGCFGASAPVSYPQTLLRDLALIAAAAGLAVILRKTEKRNAAAE